MIYDTQDFFHWDPSPDLVVIPYLEHPLRWYGAFFALGFVLSYYLVLRIFRKTFANEDKATKLADALVVYIVFATIIGARLGHVFFYSWPIYQRDPLSILRVWEGGLASHGAAVAIVLTVFFFVWMKKQTFPGLTRTYLLDVLCIPSALAGAFIRVGNFFNQELVGTPSQVPWAVVFGHPSHGGAVLPRHPVQLYEAFFYLFTFFFLYRLWQLKIYPLGKGYFFALFLIFVFSFRFFAEFFKEAQSMLLEENVIFSMGHYLSIPFILGGLIYYYKVRRRDEVPNQS